MKLWTEPARAASQVCILCCQIDEGTTLRTVIWPPKNGKGGGPGRDWEVEIVVDGVPQVIGKGDGPRATAAYAEAYRKVRAAPVGTVIEFGALKGEQP